jgi:hypothetical protein
MYKMVYANEGLKLSPCMDAGWDTGDVKEAIRMACESGRLYRKVLLSGKYEFVVENNLKEIPQGLNLYRISGKYRVWRVPALLRAPTGNAAACEGHGGKSCPSKS